MRSHPASSLSLGAPVLVQRTAGPAALFDCPDLGGIPLPFERNAEIYGEGEENDYVYLIVSGVVRTCKILADGRRQISGFYYRGDVVGLDAGPTHWCSAEAVTPCSILVVRRSLLHKTAERNGNVSAKLLTMAMGELQRSQAHAMLLVKSAQERIAAFLIEMADRAPGQTTIELPMSRQDIGDYLGLTIETVSRTITQLSDSHAIELVASRRIVVRNHIALSDLNA